MKHSPSTGPSPARRRAAEALGVAASHYPDLPPLSFDTEGLSPRDARLAQAIRRVTLQRWITLEHLLNGWLRRPVFALEPPLRGILLGGAAALLFLDRQPAHAVVDESVELARRIVRPGAGGLVNAVLRRAARAVRCREPSVAWQPGTTRLPWDGGTCLLEEPLLPDPGEAWEEHIAVATSHPRNLVASWQRRFGRAMVVPLCLHGLRTPPVILAFEPGTDLGGGEHLRDHQAPSHAIWSGPPGTLAGFLAARPELRVQDPTAALPLADETGTPVESVLDFCAGLGTKTHQLACLYPSARVIAHEVDPRRREGLRRRFADGQGVEVVASVEEVRIRLPSGADLLVLDVPCSNTGVLARRPEARYRYGARTLRSLTELQRRILLAALPLLRPGGRLLYTTCSLEEDENEAQVRWVIARSGLALRHEKTTLPGGAFDDYRDGGYFAWLEDGRK